MYFSRFTQKSKKVIELSLECAREFGHNRVDSEHLLLGLSKEGDGVASRVLLKLGITPKYIEGKIIEKKGIIPIMPIDLVLSPRSEEILEISGIFADKFKSEYIETEHILLGILQQGENLAVNILKEAGIEVEQVRKLHETEPNILDVVKNKEVDLVVNTPTKGNDSKRDGFLIRRAAVERNIGVITALDTLRAIAEVKVEEIENKDLEVFNMAE